MYYGDMTDATNLILIVQQVQPDESITLRHKSVMRLVLKHRNT
jgi:GDP-D-mannose dehydratase